MDIPYFIKEHLWMSVSDEATQKYLVEVNPPRSWPWKQNGTSVVASKMILEVVNNWRSMLQINIKKKKILNPNHLPLQEKYVISIWLVSAWRICLTEILEEKHFKLRYYLNQI